MKMHKPFLETFYQEGVNAYFIFINHLKTMDVVVEGKDEM